LNPYSDGLQARHGEDIAPRKRTGQPTMLLALAVALVSIFVSAGCSRTVLVESGKPIRIAADCDCYIYTLADDGEWVRSGNRIRISEGWYAVDPSFVVDEK